MKSPTEEQEKDVFRTLSSTIELRNFDSFGRYRNEASMLGVLYPYANGIPFCKGAYMVYIHYNTRWRGLAELLISKEGQCEGQIVG